MKNLLICGTFYPEDIAALRGAIARAHPWRARDWQIITGDGHDLEAEVLRLCLKEKVRCRVFGVNKQPTNGASLSLYERVITFAATRPQRLTDRDEYMLNLAQKVIVFHDHPLLTTARYIKPIYRYDGRWVEIPLMPASPVAAWN